MSLFRPAPEDIPDIDDRLNEPWWDPRGLIDPDLEFPNPDPALVEGEDPPGGQRRIEAGTHHLLLLRAFIAFGWLRAVVDKLGDDTWWNGDAVTTFLSGGAAADPLPGFSNLIDLVLLPLATPLGWTLMAAEVGIGLAILTGFRFDAALGLGIGLSAMLLLAGQINPAAFYIVVQLALLGSPAGFVYAADPWEAPPVRAWAPWALGGAGLAVVWGGYAAESISAGSVSDPAVVLAFVGLFAIATISLLWHRERSRVNAELLSS